MVRPEDMSEKDLSYLTNHPSNNSSEHRNSHQRSDHNGNHEDSSSVMKRIAVRVMALFGAVIIGLAFLSLAILWLWGEQNIQVGNPVLIKLEPGASLSELSEELRRSGALLHPWLWQVYVRVYGDYSQARSGKYQLSRDITPRELLARIMAGQSEKELVLTLTIPEGFTLSQVAARLKAQGVGTAAEIAEALNHPSLRKEYGITAPHLEGYLYPETYQFFNQIPSPQQVVIRAVKEFFAQLPGDYQKNLKKYDLDFEEWVIFASLIEKETALEEEKSQVAEVIWNRLRQKMTLAIDATLIYGIKDFDGDLTFKHLADADNLYNTRIHHGLPPTAIGMVSKTSLEAVFQPTAQGYLYYVLEPGTSQKHYFSKSYKQHDQAVKRWVEWRTKRSPYRR